MMEDDFQSQTLGVSTGYEEWYSRSPSLQAVYLDAEKTTEEKIKLSDLLNTIFNEDCLLYLKQAKAVGLAPKVIFTDPPYNLSGKELKNTNNKTGGSFFKVNEDWDAMQSDEYFSFVREWVRLSYDLQDEGGAMYVCCSHHNLGEITIAMKEAGYKIQNIITWAKTNPMPSQTRRTFTHSSEFIVLGTKGAKWTYNHDALKAFNPEKAKDGTSRAMRDVWSAPQCQGAERIRAEDGSGRAAHPTQKPENVVERALIASSNEGDLVLDLFSGSGTTQAVAKRHRRLFSGCERNSDYFSIALKRILEG